MSTVRIQIRRGTATEWTNADTNLNSSGGLILAAGEMGVETNTRKIKIGDGSTRWSSLQYIAADSPAISEIAQDAIDQALSMGSGLTKSYNDSTNTISLGIDTDVIATTNYVDDAVGGLQNTVTSDYVLIADVGNAGGPAKLDSNGNLLVPKASIILEGLTANDFETTLSVTDPTADRTITFKDASGTVAFTSDVATAKSEANAYTDTAISNLIDAAPGALDTLNEIAAALGDDANYAATITNELADITDAVSDLSAAGLFHTQASTSVHGIADTAALATKVYADNSSQEAVGVHNQTSTNVHGISNTADLMLKTGSTMTGSLILNGEPQDAAGAATKGYVDNKETAMTQYVDGLIADTEIYADNSASDAVTAHTAITQNVHGIADTSALALTADVDSALALKQDKVSGVSDTEIGYLDGVTSAIQTQLNGKSDTTHGHGITEITNLFEELSAKAPSDNPTFTGTVVLPSTTSVGNVSSTEIGYLNGITSDVQTQIDSKAALSGATFTGDVTVETNLVVDGDFTVNGTNFSASATSITIEDNMVQLAHQNSANTVDLGLVVAYNDGAAKHAGIVRDVSDAKWKLFKGVTTEPSTVVDFTQGSLDDLAVNAIEAASATIGDVSNTELQYLNGVTSGIQTQIDAKSPINNPTFTGTVTVAQSGIAFTDGTQTKEGVPSRTPIISRSQDYTLSSLDERDSLIEVDSQSPVTITIPRNSSVAFPVGTALDILGVNTGLITIAGAQGVTVNATPGLKLRTQWSSCTLFKRGENAWVVYGDLKA